MSIGFLLSSPEDAVIWRGPKKNGVWKFVTLQLIHRTLSYNYAGLIKQFLRDVNWGEVDYLLVDTPPGTSDEHLSLVQYLSSTHVDGAILVTTPQEVALMDVRREINFCRKVNLPILGVVENMSAFICPKCAVRVTVKLKSFIMISVCRNHPRYSLLLLEGLKRWQKIWELLTWEPLNWIQDLESLVILESPSLVNSLTLV